MPSCIFVRASLEHNRLGRFNTGFSFGAEDLRGADRLTTDAAVGVLCYRTNRALKIYDGEDEVLGGRADTFYNIPEKLIDYQKLVAGQEGTEIRQPRRCLDPAYQRLKPVFPHGTSEHTNKTSAGGHSSMSMACCAWT